MAVTSGFFNSRDGDRRYDARQVSELFDGVIGDGVFMHVGEGLQVFPTNSPNTVSVGTGRCWFDHVWVKNWPSRHLVSLPAPDEYYMRYDAIVVEIDHSTSGRYGYITWVKGTASSNPALPTLLNEGDHGRTQHPLAYVRRFANTTTINSSDINSRVGFSDCPWVVAPAGFVDLNKYWSNWEQQWSNWFTNAQNENETEFSEFLENKNQEYNQFQINTMNEWASLKSELDAQTTAAVNASQDAIDGTLAGQLQKQIDDLEFMNNMRPFPFMTISDEADTPEMWYHTGSGYGALTYDPSVGGITFGVIESFISPYDYTYSSEGDESPNDQNGYFISQIMRTNSPKALYVRTGYYRASKYDDTTTVELETGWDTGDDNANGWMRVASYNEVSNKVSKSGDTMYGSLSISGANLYLTHTYQSGTTQNIEVHNNDNEDTPFIAYKKNGSQKNYLQFTETESRLGKPLVIGSGGTGANTAINARINLSTFGAELIGSHWGITKPDGGKDIYVRTPKLGLLPYEQNIGCNLGSGGGWQFDKAFINLIYPLKSSYSIADFVIASGSQSLTNENYIWLKFNSGYAIVSFYKYVWATAPRVGIEITYPFTIYHSRPVINAEVTSHPDIYVGYTSYTNDHCSCYICNVPAAANAQVFGIIAGKWK